MCGAGPETWWIYYPSASGGMQSPIDVTTEEVLFDPELRNNPLELSYWRASAALAAADEDEDDGVGSSREKLVLVNTGNTARLDVVNNSSCKPRQRCKVYKRFLFSAHYSVLHSLESCPFLRSRFKSLRY